MSKVTQSDIAKSLGLSPSTVGLVVGGSKSPLRERLNKETVRRILEKADELGYHPNRTAQIMRKGRSNLITLLNMGGHSELAGQRAFHVGHFVHKAGFDYQSVEAYWWPGDGKRIINQVIDLHPEGVIITGALQTEMDLDHLKRRTPVVSLNMHSPIPGVVIDSAQAIAELTSACIAQGRKRIALLIRTSTHGFVHEREAGFLRAIAAAGWPPPEEYAVCGPLPTPRKSPHAVIFRDHRPNSRFEPYNLGASSAAWFRDYPDAVICTNDNFALGVLSYYQSHGIAVPEQVAVSGFDNISFSALENIGLTTVAQPIRAMSEMAVEMLTSVIKDPTTRVENRPFACDIVWRQTMSAAHSKGDAPLIH